MRLSISLRDGVKKNIRELEGVLKKVLFYQEQKNAEITMKIAESIIEKATQNLSKRVNEAGYSKGGRRIL